MERPSSSRRGRKPAAERTGFGRHFVTFQFPVVDLRSLKRDKEGRLQAPAWPEPRPAVEFVRSTGVVQDRPRGAIDYWDGERSFVDAARLLRVEPPKAGGSPAFRVRYRRLYGSSVTYRVDIGFDYWLSAAEKFRLQHPGTPEADAARELALIRTRLGSSQGELTSAGPHLAVLLGRRTTSAMHLSQHILPRLHAGRPLAMVEVGVGNQRSVQVATALTRSKIRTPIYVLRTTGGDRLLERNLRAAIWRLHSELETLQEVARQWNSAPDEFAEEELLEYLDHATKSLVREHSAGLPNAPLVALATELPTFATTELSRLTDLLGARSKGIQRRLQIALERAADAELLRSAYGSTVVLDRRTSMTKNRFKFEGPTSGVFGTNTNVSGNTFTASAETPEVILQLLRQQLAELNSFLPDNALLAASEQLDEAQAAGDKKRLSKTLSSIYEAIKGAGQAALPALESIEKIQGLIT